MTQDELFELEVAALTPTSGTARLRWTGIASDGWKYAIKRTSDHPLLPLSEWFCHRLAEAVHLPVPPYRALRLKCDGTLAFGSRWEGSARQLGDMPPADQKRYLVQGKNICKILGLDLFLPNTDRHFGNFLWHQIDGTVRAMAFDYSESWAMHEGGLHNPKAMEPKCNTFKVMDFLSVFGALKPHEIGETAGRLMQISDKKVAAIAQTIPAEWVSELDEGAIMAWWRAPSTRARLTVLAAQYPCLLSTTNSQSLS